jgi:hypothetical protein
MGLLIKKVYMVFPIITCFVLPLHKEYRLRFSVFSSQLIDLKISISY